MRNSLRRTLIAGLFVGWLSAVGFGALRLWKYDSTAGIAAMAPDKWSGDVLLPANGALPQLIVFIHPHCPCSRATIGELSRIMAVCQNKLTVNVLFVRPTSMPDGWENSDLWKSASAIPGVNVLTDVGGSESAKFGATTSGQTFLYGVDGRLLFAGGITESRGHSGDNAGESAIEQLLIDAPRGTSIAHTPVYGCVLRDAASSVGDTPCRK
jgi:hypothetical protein